MEEEVIKTQIITAITGNHAVEKVLQIHHQVAIDLMVKSKIEVLTAAQDQIDQEMNQTVIQMSNISA